MGNFIMISQFILSLTILVVLHEFGHFLPARWFQTKVEKFYLFFNPWFSLFKKKIGDTEWGIGWLPLGGYVKIAGMVDESFDTEQLKSEPQPYEFRSKPAWQRLIIMLGGVTVNFILGFLIFGMMLWYYGKEYIPTSELKYGIITDSLTYEMGFRDGDKIMKIGNTNLEQFDRSKIIKAMVLDNVNTLTVERNGQMQEIVVDAKYIQALTKPEAKEYRLWSIPVPTQVAKVAPGMPAEKAGIKAEDRIYSIDGMNVTYMHEIHKIMANKKNTAVVLGVIRGADSLSITLTSNDKGQIGFDNKPFSEYYTTKKEEFSLMQAFPKGIAMGWDVLSNYVKSIKQMFTGKVKAKDSLGGFASIANMFEKTWDWESFWRMTAVLSIILGFMNLLPIPALDGGYVMFLLAEVVSGKKIDDKIIEKATMVGFFLLLGLMIFANGMDVIRAWF